jgi:signal transduction histidine kinase
MNLNALAVVKRGHFVFPLACLAALALLFISEGSYWQSVSSLDRLRSVQESRSNIQQMAQGILDAESGQRGYLLTARKEYLVPYAKALQTIEQSFRFLDHYYGADARSIEVLGRLHALTATKLSELSETIRLFDEGKGDAAKELVLSDIGKEKMEALRALGAELLAAETLNVAQGQQDLRQTLTLSRIGLAALSAISLLALFLFLRQTVAAEQHQADLKRTVLAERDRLEVEVGQRTAQLTELTDHLQTAREDERNRLARNLHDELGALLTSAKLDAARIRSRLAGTAPEALERLSHLVDTLNASIALGRQIIEDLRPSTLSNLGLAATLQILLRDFAERAGVKVHCDLAAVQLDPGAELVVYRLVQEAITNISKYAKARNVWLNLSLNDGKVEVTVRDDGVGFDTTTQPRSAYGLLGMRFRVEAEGGTMAMESAPQRGTQIRVRLPESPLAAA